MNRSTANGVTAMGVTANCVTVMDVTVMDITANAVTVMGVTVTGVTATREGGHTPRVAKGGMNGQRLRRPPNRVLRHIHGVRGGEGGGGDVEHTHACLPQHTVHGAHASA